MRDTISGQFVGAPGRRIFVLQRTPAASRVAGSVLFVPPFGEEMNKSRRLMAETAALLCREGVPVLLPDLFGTGDSEGEFREATVEQWFGDLEVACRHATALGHPVRAVVAVRLGCALAALAARRGALPAVAVSAWWQPVLEGRRFVAQFLRLRVAAAGMRGAARETVDSLRARSSAGETLEVAGYEVSPALLRGLEGLVVDSLPSQAGHLHWYEVLREEGGAPPLPAARFVERARAAGVAVDLTGLAGEPFWGATELVRLPLLVELTAAAVVRSLSSGHGLAPPDSRAEA